MNQNGKNNTFQTDILPETDFADLEAELSRMAKETPEMPETFHSAWTAAVRAEAQTAAKTRKKTESKRQWRYILSAAAVFVFLIGGTAVTRMVRSNEKKNRNAEQAPAVMMALQEDAEENAAAGWTISGEEDAGEAEEEMAGAYEAAGIEWDGEEAGDADTGELVTDDYEGIYAIEDAMVPMGDAPMEEAAEEAAAEAEEEQEAGEAMGGMPMAESAAKAVNAPEATSAPTPEATEAPAPEEKKAADDAADVKEEAEEAPQESEAAEEDESFAGFMKDLWAFTLRALPWLLGAAALIAAAALIRRKAGKKA